MVTRFRNYYARDEDEAYRIAEGRNDGFEVIAVREISNEQYEIEVERMINDRLEADRPYRVELRKERR